MPWATAQRVSSSSSVARTSQRQTGWARVGTAPAPWQEPLLAAAREQAAAIGKPPWGAENTPSASLAALVHVAAADDGSTI